MQRIKLLRSQKILLQMKSEKVQKFITLAQVTQKEVQATLKLAMIELGVPEEELNQWKLSEDEQAIEKIEPEIPPEDKDKEEKKLESEKESETEGKKPKDN